MTYFIIALSADHPDAPPEPDKCYWCGYIGQGKTHLWTVGELGYDLAIRFYDRDSAVRAGVSGPHLPNPPSQGQPQDWKNRGVQIIQITY